MKNLKASYYILIFSLFSISCQSWEEPDVQKLPKSWQDKFHPCAPLDGDGHLVLISQEITLSGEFEWRSDKEFLLNVYGPLGRAVLKVHTSKAGKKITLSGPMAKRLPPVSLGATGELIVDGYEVPLALDELGCFLANRLPKSFFQSAQRMNAREESLSLISDDRDIYVTDLNDQRCAQIEWGGVLGLMPSRIRACFSSAGVGSVDLGEAQIKWSPLSR